MPLKVSLPESDGSHQSFAVAPLASSGHPELLTHSRLCAGIFWKVIWLSWR